MNFYKLINNTLINLDQVLQIDTQTTDSRRSYQLTFHYGKDQNTTMSFPTKESRDKELEDLQSFISNRNTRPPTNKEKREND